jgi:hypothetical protein
MDLLNRLMETKKVSQDKDVKDKDGTQPAKYYAGDMSKSTKDKRDAHFKAKKSGPAPGDASAETKKSKHTMKFDRMFNEDKGLDAKAKKSGISKSILKKVYDRGLAAYKTGHRPGATAPQWAMARVNSFITKGKGTWGGADKDLAKQVSEWNEMEEACWAGYKQVGMKKKGNKEVPNCVPEETVNENVAVKQAELKAKQVEEMEALKEKQEKELEALKLRHERDNEKLSKEKEGESERDRLSNESVEEGKYVSNYRDVVDVIFKKIKSKIEKDFERNQEKGVAIINTLGAMVGHKVTDKGQEKHKLFLKFGEELEEGVDVKKALKSVKGISKKQTEMLMALPSSVLMNLVQQLSSIVMGEELEERHSDVMRKRNQSQQKAHQKAMMKSARKSIKDYDAKNKNKNEESEVEEDRDYKKEYENYHSDPEQIKRRAKRNEARRSLKNSKKLTADKDVHHKDNNPMNNDKSNLSIVSQNYNRKEPRMRDKLKEKGCLPNGKRK